MQINLANAFNRELIERELLPQITQMYADVFVCCRSSVSSVANLGKPINL